MSGITRIRVPLVLLSVMLVIVACSATQEDLAEQDGAAEGGAAVEESSDDDDSAAEEDDDAVASDGTSQAEGYPDRSITYVVPWAAGGSADAIARIVEEHGSERIGGDVVVENRDGAGGTIALSQVARAEPDGYTLVQPAVGPFTTQDYLQDLEYVLDDFEPVINLTQETVIIAAQAERGWENLDDMFDEFRESGEVLQYGSSGAGTLQHMGQLDLYEYVDIDAEHVPFEGGARSIPALLGGNVDVITAHVAELVEHAEAGSINLLAVLSEERDPQIPDVATAEEQAGYDTYWDVYKFVMAPAGTPQAIVDHLHDGLEEMLNDDGAASALGDLGIAVRYMDGEELAETLRRDHEVMGSVMTESGIQDDIE